jgi:hypothetical protein
MKATTLCLILGLACSVAYARTLPIEHGATTIVSAKAFASLAHNADVRGAHGVQQVKFLMVDVHTRSPALYFMNTNTFDSHHEFANGALRLRLTLDRFNQQTYFTDRRRFIAGTIVHHPSARSKSGGKGVYALEFWPTDPVKAPHVAMAYNAVLKGMPFAKGRLAYHAVGETHEALFKEESAVYANSGIAHVTTEQLMGKVSFTPLNLGEAFGRLRLISATSSRQPTIQDIVIFRTLPNDLTHVAGVITEAPQTPLSHINLKAKQNNTPNAYLKNASRAPHIAPLLGKLVHIKVTTEGVAIREASREEVARYHEQVRPAKPQIPVRDLRQKKIVSLSTIGRRDAPAYGAKAANLAELRKVVRPPVLVPNGYAIPFYYYDYFMKEAGLYDEARKMLADEQFKTDPDYRKDQLKAFRNTVKSTPVPEGMAEVLGKLQAAFPPGRPMRCRSSTNNEDLKDFNGAGLYDSCTHRLDEGHIQKSVKQVWASLWNFRAFEEREFYRIDHFQTAMGVLVHPNYDDERANGVAVTKNVFDPENTGYYINVQVGEAMVTNPEGNVTPDELLVLRTLISDIPRKYGFEPIYIRRSSLVKPPDHVMTRPQLEALAAELKRIHEHFKGRLRQIGNENFAMDIEFKVDKDNQLVIKQARPWVD